MTFYTFNLMMDAIKFSLKTLENFDESLKPAFGYCVEHNLYEIVDAQIDALESYFENSGAISYFIFDLEWGETADISIRELYNSLQ